MTLDVVEKLKKGYKAIGRTYKNHIDGFNLLPYLTGEAKESPRNLFFYFSDDGDVLALRFDNWKIVFMEQRCQGTLQVWAEPFVAAARAEDSTTCAPILTNSRTSPRIRTGTGTCTMCYMIYRGPDGRLAKFAETFKDFPAIQKPNTFTIDDALEKMARRAAAPIS